MTHDQSGLELSWSIERLQGSKDQLKPQRDLITNSPVSEAALPTQKLGHLCGHMHPSSSRPRVPCRQFGKSLVQE